MEGDFYEELELRVGEEIREALTRARRAVLTPTSKRLARVLRRLLTALPAYHVAQVRASSQLRLLNKQAFGHVSTNPWASQLTLPFVPREGWIEIKSPD